MLGVLNSWLVRSALQTLTLQLQMGCFASFRADSAPIKRLVQDAREKGALIDASYGRRTQAVLIMDSDHVILSGIPLESITGRFAQEEES